MMVQRPYDHPTTKFRMREARQVENKDGSSNEKESELIVQRLEFQNFNRKQSQHCQPSNQGKPCPAANCQAQLKSAYQMQQLTTSMNLWNSP
eukprot:1161712-Pelagomonas_calceolata.AAC.1